jgi:hypothetical protein
MAWSLYTHANISVKNPRPLGVCDKCGFVYNRDMLHWQYDWVGPHLFNKRILVCHTCMDKPQEQLRTIVVPADPIPIANPRPGEFAGMVISSSPDIHATIVPSELVLESSSAPNLGTIGNRIPIVTETSSLPLLTEHTVTPNPDPEFGDGGYTIGSSS